MDRTGTDTVHDRPVTSLVEFLDGVAAAEGCAVTTGHGRGCSGVRPQASSEDVKGPGPGRSDAGSPRPSGCPGRTGVTSIQGAILAQPSAVRDSDASQIATTIVLARGDLPREPRSRPQRSRSRGDGSERAPSARSRWPTLARSWVRPRPRLAAARPGSGANLGVVLARGPAFACDDRSADRRQPLLVTFGWDGSWGAGSSRPVQDGRAAAQPAASGR